MTLFARRRIGLTVALSSLFLVTSLAHAAAPRTKTLREPDLLPRSSGETHTKTLRSATRDGAPTTIAGLNRDDVGDVESFGNHLVWLGVAQTQTVSLRSDCTGADPTYERCITLNPQPAATSFNEMKLDHLIIPGGSSLSLLCQWITPFWTYQFHNLTGVNQSNAHITLVPYITIYNDVLNDPAAIDPNTGLPYGGQIEMGMATTHMESRSLEAGERQMQRLNYSRVCIGGIVSTNSLVDNFGLPQHLADVFLQKDTTILFHLRGSASLVDDATLFYGARIVGDQKP